MLPDTRPACFDNSLDTARWRSVAGFSVLDNHLHVLLRLDPEVAQGWSNEGFAGS
jgi:hypothetical protein